MGCRSAVHLHSVAHPPSAELFGESLSLRDLPESKGVSGVGLSDGRGLAGRLVEALARAKHERLRGEVRFDTTRPSEGFAPVRDHRPSGLFPVRRPCPEG